MGLGSGLGLGAPAHRPSLELGLGIWLGLGVGAVPLKTSWQLEGWAHRTLWEVDVGLAPELGLRWLGSKWGWGWGAPGWDFTWQ